MLRVVVSKVKNKDKFPVRSDIKGLIHIADLSENSIRKHITKAKIPKGKDGKYNTKKVLEAIQAHRKKDNKNSPGNEGRVRKIELECELLQVKIDQIKGELISRTEHMGDLLHHANVVKKNLLSLEREISSILKDPKVNKVVKTKITSTLTAISGDIAA